MTGCAPRATPPAAMDSAAESASQLLHDVHLANAGESWLLQCPSHLGTRESQGWEPLIPQRPTVRLPFYQHQLARFPGFFQPLQSIGDNFPVSLAPARPLASDKRRPDSGTWRECAIYKMIGNVQAAIRIFHDAEMEEDLPGQLLLQCLVEQGKCRVAHTV